jgi:hypothetical protein
MKILEIHYNELKIATAITFSFTEIQNKSLNNKKNHRIHVEIKDINRRLYAAYAVKDGGTWLSIKPHVNSSTFQQHRISLEEYQQLKELIRNPFKVMFPESITLPISTRKILNAINEIEI